MAKKTKIVITDTIPATEVSVEDGGCYKGIVLTNDDEIEGMYVRLCSWDDYKQHEEFNKLIGKKVKITIETID